MNHLLLQNGGRRVGKALRGLNREEVVVVACSASGCVVAYEVARILRARLMWCPLIPIVNQDGHIVGAEGVTQVFRHPDVEEIEGEPLYVVPPTTPHHPKIDTQTTLILVESEWWQGSWGLYALLEELGVSFSPKRLIVCGITAPPGLRNQLCPPAHTTLFLEESVLTSPSLPEPEWITDTWIERQFTNLARVRSRSKRYTSS